VLSNFALKFNVRRYTMAGNVAPAKVLVVGAGVAGLAAGAYTRPLFGST